MRKIILLILLLQFCIFVYAQSIDDLVSAVKKIDNQEEKADLHNAIGIKYRDANQLEEAIDQHLQALDIYEQLHDNNGQATSLYYLGGVYWRKNDYEQSLHYYTLALQIQEQLDELEEKAKILNNMGLASRSLGDYETALEYYYRALGCWFQEDNKEEVAATLNHIGNVFLNKNDSDSALTYYNKALLIRRNLNDTVAVATTLSNLATLYKNKSDFETAQNYLKQSVELLMMVDNDAKLADSYNLLGGVFWQDKQYKNALEKYLKALKIREELGDKKLITATMNNIGLIYKDLGNYEKALEYYNKSMEQYKLMNDRFLESNALNFIGGVYWQKGDYAKARDSYKRSLGLRIIVGDRKYQARSYNNIALVYKSMGERDSALIEYQKAHEIYDEIGDDKNAAALINNIGNLHKRFEEYDAAITYFTIALSKRKEIGDLNGEAYSSLDLGNVLMLQNSNMDAISLFNRALWIAREMKNINLEKDVLYAFAKVYEKEGQYEKAYKHFTAYENIKDKIISTESIKKIADMQIRYETEKKEKEIKVKDIQIIKQREKNRQQQNMLYFGLVLVVTISIFSIFIVRKNKKIKQANALLEISNAEILQQKEEIQTQRDAIIDQKDEIEGQKVELEERGKRIELVSEFGKRITSNLDLASINSMLYEYLSQGVTISSFGIGLYDDENNKLKYPFFYKNGKIVEEKPEDKLDDNKSIVAWSFNNNKVIFSNNITDDFVDFFYDEDSVVISTDEHSRVCLPLFTDSKKIGMLVVNSVEANAFSELDFFNLQTLASYISIALDNYDAYKRIKDQKRKIDDSIEYASRIQEAVLPPVDFQKTVLPDHFIVFKPRDVVSGDFYWMTKIDNLSIVAAVDCTGHGVPGAFMSMLGTSLFTKIVNRRNWKTAADILNQLRVELKKSLHQTGDNNSPTDGMDCALCIIDFEAKKVQFSGAHNPLYLVRNGELLEYDADRMPIGVYMLEEEPFSNKEIDLLKGDLLYTFSDGFYDQFGGEKGRKFYSKNFKALLQDASSKPINKQKELIEETFTSWKGNRRQIDDVLVIGIKI